MPDINNFRENDLFWLTHSEVSVYHGREGMAEQRGSHRGGQEAGKEKYRKRMGQDTVFNDDRGCTYTPATYSNQTGNFSTSQ
jgi:hypothetical protein